MIRLPRHATVVFLFGFLCGLGSLCSLVQVNGQGNALSNVDRYSEANALREVRNFLEHGLTGDKGLGNVLYPGLYPEDGFAHDLEKAGRSLTPSGVYTHYPPGPEYLLYATALLLGPEPVSHLRVLPILTGWAAMLFLGMSVRQRFGATVGWLVMASLILTPAVTDGFVGLHYQGYALALLMVEIGLVLRARPSLAPFAALGFLQGWLSFDYVFLVTLAPLALDIALRRIDPAPASGRAPRRWLAVGRVLCAGGGFAAAHGLHFLQVVAFWGSLDLAIADIAAAAAHRAGVESLHGPLDFAIGAFTNLTIYFLGLHPFHFGLDLPEAGVPGLWSMFRFLGVSLGPWWMAVTAFLLVRSAALPAADSRATRMDWYIVSLCGILTSSCWFTVMTNHGFAHVHFLYRHLFFAFFLAILFAAVRSRGLVERMVSPAAAGVPTAV